MLRKIEIQVTATVFIVASLRTAKMQRENRRHGNRYMNNSEHHRSGRPSGTRAIQNNHDFNKTSNHRSLLGARDQLRTSKNHMSNRLRFSSSAFSPALPRVQSKTSPQLHSPIIPESSLYPVLNNGTQQTYCEKSPSSSETSLPSLGPNPETNKVPFSPFESAYLLSSINVAYARLLARQIQMSQGPETRAQGIADRVQTQPSPSVPFQALTSKTAANGPVSNGEWDLLYRPRFPKPPLPNLNEAKDAIDFPPSFFPQRSPQWIQRSNFDPSALFRNPLDAYTRNPLATTTVGLSNPWFTLPRDDHMTHTSAVKMNSVGIMSQPQATFISSSPLMSPALLATVTSSALSLSKNTDLSNQSAGSGNTPTKLTSTHCYDSSLFYTAMFAQLLQGSVTNRAVTDVDKASEHLKLDSTTKFSTPHDTHFPRSSAFGHTEPKSCVLTEEETSPLDCTKNTILSIEKLLDAEYHQNKLKATENANCRTQQDMNPHGLNSPLGLPFNLAQRSTIPMLSTAFTKSRMGDYSFRI
ncbi:hypothetical protein P879_06998 [Paragonimus westermani]|uniref:Uncharacterized protein n=1 Tax=Paragonimus westermani TaxID=34504 RepID=A0A8T0D736_9TREM|nr:hypothetical protein P879_06998 [Paragonimus westermani]